MWQNWPNNTTRTLTSHQTEQRSSLAFIQHSAQFLTQSTCKFGPQKASFLSCCGQKHDPCPSNFLLPISNPSFISKPCTRHWGQVWGNSSGAAPKSCDGPRVPANQTTSQASHDFKSLGIESEHRVSVFHVFLWCASFMGIWGCRGGYPFTLVRRDDEFERRNESPQEQKKTENFDLSWTDSGANEKPWHKIYHLQSI